MAGNSVRIIFNFFFLMLTLLPPSKSEAALGQSELSTQNDQAALLSAIPKITNLKKYKVYNFKVNSETSFREFVSSDGTIFAIAWNGLRHPNFQVLLGNYWTEYLSDLSDHPRIPGRRSNSRKTSHLVLEKWGHQRDIHGRAYDPSLLPEGVQPNEIL